MIGLNMLTVCLKSQVSGNKICLTQQELDYFVNQDLNAKYLVVDTTLKGIKYRQCDSINSVNDKKIAYFRANEIDLKEISKKKDIIIANNKMDIIKLNDKCDKQVRINKRLKNGLIISGSIIVLQSSLIYLFVK